MTLTELKYVVAVARERHFGRAAKSCFVSQPTLSAGVRKLEDELGVRIFERESGEVIVTPAGARVVAQAQRTLEEAARVKSIAVAGRDDLQGPLRLGAIYTVGPYLLPHFLPRLRKAAPDMPLIIEENYTARLRDKLRAGELDVVIVALPFDEPGVITWPLYEEPFVVVMPADHPWRARRGIRARELAEQPVLLLGPGHCFRDQVLAGCPNCVGSAQGGTSFEGGSLETIRHMVASGLGVSVLPVTATGYGAAKARKDSLLVERPFEGPAPDRTVVLAFRRGFPRPRAIATLRRAIIESSLRGVDWLDFAKPSEEFPVT
jgi:LysR family hydrogen peroxide-inducible transcriptional activator